VKALAFFCLTPWIGLEYTDGSCWAWLWPGGVAPSQLNSVEPSSGVVGMGGAALGLPAAFTGGVSGFSVGAIQRALTNWAEGGAWYEGVVQNAIVGAVGGAVAGGVVGAMNPENLPAKVLVGGFVGGGVSAGTQVAFNVAGGRPWNEGVGTAFGMGFANGAIDAFTDYYGDKLVERAMTPRSAASDADGWRRPGDVDVDGRSSKLRDAWDWLRGVPGDEQGSIRLGPADKVRRLQPNDAVDATERPLARHDDFAAKQPGQDRPGPDKQRLLGELRSGTPHSRKIADLIERGEIDVHLLNEMEFAQSHRLKFGQDPDSLDIGFRDDDQIYLRADKLTPDEISVKVVHEATHIIDEENVLILDREMLAYVREAEFAESLDLPSEALDILRRGGYPELEVSVRGSYPPDPLASDPDTLRMKLVQYDYSESTIERVLLNADPEMRRIHRAVLSYDKPEYFSGILDDSARIRWLLQSKPAHTVERYFDYLELLRSIGRERKVD
jgi:hypothetical protein